LGCWDSGQFQTQKQLKSFRRETAVQLSRTKGKNPERDSCSNRGQQALGGLGGKTATSVLVDTLISQKKEDKGEKKKSSSPYTHMRGGVLIKRTRGGRRKGDSFQGCPRGLVEKKKEITEGARNWEKNGSGVPDPNSRSRNTTRK